MSITDKIKSLSKQYLAPFATGVMSLYACPTAMAVGSRGIMQQGISKAKYYASLLAGGAVGCAANAYALTHSNADNVVRMIALMVATNVGSTMLEAGINSATRRWNQRFGRAYTNYSTPTTGYVAQREITRPEFNIKKYDLSCLKSSRDQKYVDTTSAARIAAEKEMARRILQS